MLTFVRMFFSKSASVLWHANWAVSKAAYAFGLRDKKLSSKIFSIQTIDPIELSFDQWVNVYKAKRPKEAAIMILIEISAFWKKQASIVDDPNLRKSYFLYHSLCEEGAKTLAKLVWLAENNTDKIVEESISKKSNS